MSLRVPLQSMLLSLIQLASPTRTAASTMWFQSRGNGIYHFTDTWLHSHSHYLEEKGRGDPKLSCVCWFIFNFQQYISDGEIPGGKRLAGRQNTRFLEDSSCSVNACWPAPGRCISTFAPTPRKHWETKGRHGRVPSTVCSPRQWADERQDSQGAPQSVKHTCGFKDTLVTFWNSISWEELNVQPLWFLELHHR